MTLIKEKLKLLPTQPGCYLMKDERGSIIYVGKAKELKNRVRSYFTGNHTTKTQRLVAEIADFEYIVTTTNTEALLLEINLIKKHTPKYNILLKDDKTYPYLKLTNEKHPRLLMVRKIVKDGAAYFGPYANTGAASEVKKVLDRIFPLRKCDVLPKKTCLYYHIGQCLAPCILLVEQEEKQTAEHVKHFLKGNIREVKGELKRKMDEASEQLLFEKAKNYRDQLLDIEKIMSKQTIDIKDFMDRDVFGYYVQDGWISIQVFFVRNGKFVERDSSIYQTYRSPEEEMESFIAQFYTTHLKPKELLVPLGMDEQLIEEAVSIRVKVPKRGEKKALLALANENAKLKLQEKITLLEKKEITVQQALSEISASLSIPIPYRIEAFDNSNIQGVDAVSAMVVFINGNPDKNAYRKYKIKTVVGPDDYNSMREVVRRRYERVLLEKGPFPDLILIDGGIGHVNAAKEVLATLGLTIPIAGLVKNEKHQTDALLSGETMQHVPLKKTSQGFYLLQRIQDEVHRFAITFFRKTHQKSTITSALDGIEGVGKTRKKILYQHFQTIEKMKKATLADYQQLGVPAKVAQRILDTLQNKK